MDEMAALKKQLAPQEILFVADAMTGQDAVKSAEAFHKRLALTGDGADEDGWRCAGRRGAVDSTCDGRSR